MRLFRLFALLFAACLLVPAPLAQNFVNPQKLFVSDNSETLMVGDLNGDGRPDIIVGSTVNGSAGLGIFLQGGGIYPPSGSLTLPSGISPYCKLGDLNGDGKLDLVCAGTGTAPTLQVAVLLGNGDGTFQSPLLFNASSGQNPAAMGSGQPWVALIADVNHDGFPDVFLTLPQQYLIMPMLGDGKGNLTPGTPITSNSAAGQLTVADLNGDGNPDLISTFSPSGALEVFLGHGDGTFAPATDVPQTPTVPNTGGVLADVDGDGRLDMITGGVGVVHIFHGNGDGTFAPTPIVTLDYTDDSNDDSGMGSYLFPYGYVDVNGDGIPDIIAAGRDGLTVMLGEPGLQFAPPRHYAVPEGAFYLTAAQEFLTDMNGDGHPDFITLGPNGVYLAKANADGSFNGGTVYESGKFIGTAVLADFNEDGNPDVVTTGDTQLQMNFGKPDGTFEPPTPLPGLSLSYFDDEIGTTLVEHGDFNGDGHQDLLVINPQPQNPAASTPSLLLGRGDGTFQAPVALSGVPLVAFFQIYVSDLNHDGKDDLAVYDEQGNLTTYLSNGNGTFRSVTTTLTPVSGENLAEFVTFADINGDGIPDLLYTTTNHIGIMLGKGDGTFASAILLNVPSISGAQSVSPGYLSVADLNGDGAADIALLVPYAAQGSYLPADSSAIFTFYQQPNTSGFGVGSFPSATNRSTIDHAYSLLTIADVTGDGVPDLILADPDYGYNNYGDQIAVLQGATGGGQVPPNFFVGGLTVDQLFTADLNHDGLNDLLAVNGTNSFAVLLNQSQSALPAPVLTGTLTATPSPVNVGQSFAITAVLNDSASASSLTGTVTFSLDGTTIGTEPIVGFNASITAPSNLTSGTHQLSATTSTVSDGTNAFQAITLTSTEQVVAPKLPTNTTVTLAPNPSTYGQPLIFTAHVTSASASNLVPTGQVVFTFCRGATITGPLDATGAVTIFYPIPNTISNPVGACSFTGAYSGDANFLPSTSSPVTMVITPAPSTMTLSASPNPAYNGQPVSFQAVIQGVLSPTANPVTGQAIPPGTIQITGTVQFKDGTTVVGSGTVNAGVATLNILAMSTGTHTITAVYPGDANLGGSTASTTVTVLPSYFTITLSPSALSMQSGGHASAQVNLTSIGGYAGTLALSIGTLPSGLSGAFSPAAVSLTAAAKGSSNLAITSNLSAANAATRTSWPGTRSRGAPIALALLISLPLCLRRRSVSRLLTALLATILVTGIVGCSNIGYPYFVTAPGTYTIPVTATDTITHQSQTANLTLTITP